MIVYTTLENTDLVLELLLSLTEPEPFYTEIVTNTDAFMDAAFANI